jgi:hypothetical protein
VLDICGGSILFTWHPAIITAERIIDRDSNEIIVPLSAARTSFLRSFHPLRTRMWSDLASIQFEAPQFTPAWHALRKACTVFDARLYAEVCELFANDLTGMNYLVLQYGSYLYQGEDLSKMERESRLAKLLLANQLAHEWLELVSNYEFDVLAAHEQLGNVSDCWTGPFRWLMLSPDRDSSGWLDYLLTDEEKDHHAWRFGVLLDDPRNGAWNCPDWLLRG